MGFQKLTLDHTKVTATLDSNGNTVDAQNVNTNATLSNLDNLFKDSTAAAFQVDFQNSNADFTIEYDFGENDKQYLGDIAIRFGSSNRPTAYTIQVSKDGTNYTTIHTVTSDPGANTDLLIYNSNTPGIQNGTTAVAYRSFKINFTTFSDSSECRVVYIQAFAMPLDELSFKDYNVEFDDSLLDLAGWKNPRYNGSSLRGTRINTFNKGDISYGLNPVIESKTACIFLGKDIDVGKAANKENPLTEILDHSYVTIDKILFIDLDTDEIEIVARENLNSQAFNRIIAENFPEGSTLVFKSLEKEANKLKDKHFVKFNQGQLMKLYSYQPNSDGFEDGVFGGIDLHEGKGSTDLISLSGSGLFGFGQTISSSHSLFNTSSIQFSSILPAELSFYAADYATETMGSSLANLTASTAPTLTAGSSINPDDFEDVFNYEPK